MLRFLSALFLLLLLLLAIPVHASVEVALTGQPPVTINEVYLQDGVSYLALDDILPPLGLRGHWDSVEHIYRIETPGGTVVISPGSHFLRLSGRFILILHQPRFIDGRLRVAEDFVTVQLPNVIGIPVYYRNLNPSPVATDNKDTALDRLFAFLLRKKDPEAGGPALRAVAIDPGHGGQDPGSIGIGGIKEKGVSLEVARRLEKLIKMQLGIPIYLSRDGDYSLTREQRLEAAAHPDVDAFILLHAQAGFNAEPHGIYLFVRPREEFEGGTVPAGEGESMQLARLLGEALEKAGLDFRGIIQAPLLPLGRGDLPTVMVELGYLSNPGDAAALGDPAAQDKLAQALFQGLEAFADERREAAH